MDCNLSASSVHGFPRQKYWSGLPFPSLGDLPRLGIKLASPALAGGFFPTEPPGMPLLPLVRVNHSPLVWGYNKGIRYEIQFGLDEL